MTVHLIDPTLGTGTVRLWTPEPVAAETRRFESLMDSPLKPEAALMSKLQETAQSVAKAVDPEVLANVTTPQDMLRAQALLARANVEVDLAAKIAGSVAQSINKLISAQ